MDFGEISLSKAEGAILAHSVKHRTGVFKKGRLLSAVDLILIQESGVRTVFAARLGPDDIPEDEAALTVANAIAGEGVRVQEPFTGRANVHAIEAGLVVIDPDRIRRVNRVHESLTLATSASFAVVEARQMIATVKVIPFAVPREVVAEVLAVIGADPLVRVERFKHRKAGLVITRLPQTKPSLVTKSETAMRERVSALEGELGDVIIADHSIDSVRDAIAHLHLSRHNPVLVFGASAIVDRGDVIPAALVSAGGEVVHLGMPVDPGNLLMLGRIEGANVIGVPTCARSPKVNGFDWVLERVMAGFHVSAQDIMDMGAGGLLMEIESRPSPREGKRAMPQKAPEIAAIVLAAGRSSRMGSNKLLADIGGKPMVRRTVEAVLASEARPVIVVTGHESEKVRTALDGLNVTFVSNPDYSQGLATSLRIGIASLPGAIDGALVCLADMPLVASAEINKLISAFNPGERRTIIVPVHGGERGNPVLWGREHFPEISRLDGDRGARALLDLHPEEVTEVATRSDAVLADFDTPEALARIRPEAVR
ncbi:MAG: NTP transferase domain-containing protein [Hyphomicrobiales bacterium]